MAKRGLASLARLPFYFFHAGFSGLALGLQSLLVMIDPKPERVRALNFFQNGARLRAMRWSGRQEYPVYVINREKDAFRLARFRKSCAKWGVKFERVEAINCTDPEFDFAPYDSQIAETFYGKSDFLRGAVGCFLSHAKAWRTLLDSQSSHALICEDDVRFLGPIPKTFPDFGFPNQFDLLYVNQRMADGLLVSPVSAVSGNFDFNSPFDSAIQTLDATGKMNAPGGEGYLLSREGARKLLEIFERQKIFMEVDWFMFFLCLLPEQRRSFIAKDATNRFDMLEFDEFVLNAAVATPSLLEQADGISTIAFDNPKNYISREKMH